MFDNSLPDGNFLLLIQGQPMQWSGRDYEVSSPDRRHV